MNGNGLSDLSTHTTNLSGDKSSDFPQGDVLSRGAMDYEALSIA